MLVINSFSDKNEPFVVPDAFDIEKSELLLSSYECSGNASKHIELRPYESRVYLIK